MAENGRIQGAIVKHWTWLALGMAVMAGPVAARGLDEDADLLRLSHHYRQPLHDCATIGFTVDNAALDAEATDARARLKSAGMKDSNIDTLTLLADETQLDMPGPTGDATQDYLAAKAAFAPAQTACDDMADEPVLAPFVKRAGYQLTAGDKSWLGLMQYQADAGDAARMRLIGDIYDAGIEADPDHSLALAWYTKAAKAGDTIAAAHLAANTADRPRAIAVSLKTTARRRRRRYR